MILYIKHIDIEGPETLGTFFDNKGYVSKTIELYKDRKFSENLDNVEAVVVLGGPMNVYEDERYPFLKEEDFFIKDIVEKGIPYLGICLGSQLLAKACQANISKSPEKEIGFSSVKITEQGQNDPLFSGFSSEMEVFQWHEDMFEIPKKGILLASSSACPHQAFRVGSCAYGLQFHVEITDQSIQNWAERYFDLDNSVLVDKKNKMLHDYALKKDSFNQTANRLYENFLELIK